MTFRLKQKWFLFLLLTMFTSGFAFGQASSTLTGTVVGEDGLGLIGVNVLVEGSNNGTSTDFDGNFTLNDVNLTSDKIMFSYIGYKSLVVSLSGQSTITVTLESDSEILDELVVVGYGSQSREVLTTSVSKMDTKVLENVSFSNPTSALQGSIAGLRVQSTSGQPGAQARVVLRGGTSINNPDGSNPLYVIDGVVRSNMDYINPRDIESIQVLKDAASTSIYGSRASNGVIIVETKSGKAGQTQINYSYNLISSDVGQLYELASAKDFIYFMRLGIAASGEKSPGVLSFLTQANAGGTGNDLTNNTAFTTMYLTPENSYLLDEPADQWGAIWETIPDPLDPTKDLIFKGTDFQKTVFRRSYSHDHNLSISGGSEKATFNMGLGYLSNEGIAINTDYTRLTMNLNGEIQATDKLNFFGRLTYAKVTDSQVPNVGTVFKNNINTAQTSKYAFEDGSLAPGRLFTNGNPAYYISRYDASNQRNNYMMVAGASLEILPGLMFKPQYSIVNDDYYSRSFLNSYLNGPTVLNSTRQATASQSTIVEQQADAVFRYVKSLNNVHNLETTAGFSMNKSNPRSLTSVGRDAATDLIPTVNASATPWSVNGAESELLLYGYFGRINYNFDEKYLVTLNARYDGASNLGDNYKWGFFPGMSFGWNLHKEDFWKAIPEDLLRVKLRASYGVNGNISGLGAYQAQGSYSVGDRYFGNAAIYNSSLANAELKWERSKSFNFGMDVGLFNQRVAAVLDVYQRVTDNLLTNLALPRSTGFTSVLTNLGSLENKGVEFEISANLLPVQSEFQWNLGVNAGFVKMKILELPDNGIENNRIGGINIWDESLGEYVWKGGLQEGGTIGDLFGYRQLGIFSTDEEAAAGPVDMLVVGADKTKHGGDVDWYDTDGNGIIDERDRLYMGNIYPDWTGGVTNSFAYKDFSLIVRTDFTLGHMIYNETKARVLGNFSGQNAISEAVTRSWQNQGDVTDIPRYYWADQNQKQNLRRGNSEYYESGDFLCLREITLAYSMPNNILEKLRLGNVRFNLTANNLYYFTKFTGLNPEEGGTDNGRYPVPKNIMFGVQISPSF